MNYYDLLKFLQEYILNSIPTKSISNTHIELWISCKASVQHYRLWRCPAYVINEKTEKLDAKLELCYFVGYPKGTKGWLFYNPREKIL